MSKFKIFIKKYSRLYNKKSSKERFKRSLWIRFIILILIIIVFGIVGIKNISVNFVINTLYIPTLITAFMVGFVGILLEYVFKDYLKKWNLVIKYGKMQLKVSIFIILVYIIVFSILGYLFYI